MNARLTWQQTLSGSEVAAIDAMLDRVSDADGVSSLSEHAYLHLRAGGGPKQRHLLARRDGVIAGYAFLDPENVGELLVDPAARCQGLGSLLLAEVLERGGPATRVWSHGDLPAARRLAQDMVEVRRLCRYTRSLADVPERPLPPGFTLRTFTAGDADAWLALNAEAFVDLPDQGGWSQADLDQRLRQPWFDPEGFLLAFDEAGLAGFHWTKVHAGLVGEVYVLAVAPRTRGTGLGSALTAAGLQHLRDQGLSEVMLYVDSNNTAGVALYERLGFTRADCDVQYALRG